MDRKDFLGSSDIATVMGLSRWKTPLALYAEKTGQIEPPDLSDNEAVELGSELEDFVAKKFERKTGLKVRRAPKIYTHSELYYLRCQVDRLITGTDDLLECKTASAWKEKEWEGEEIPLEYILQVQFQLWISGRKRGYIACLIGGQKFIRKHIEIDAEIVGNMKQACVKFWQMVQDRTPPMAMSGDDDILVKLYPGTNERMIEATDDINSAVALLQQTKAQIIELEKTKEEIEVKLKDVIKDNAGIITPEYLITWKPVKTGRVDVERMKEEKIYEEYLKYTETKRLTISKNKERKNGDTRNSKTGS